jgi:hypothetical protein
MFKGIGVSLFLLYFALIIGGFVGWALNLIALVNAISGPLTTLVVLRIVGIFAFPLGAILGYIS